MVQRKGLEDVTLLSPMRVVIIYLHLTASHTTIEAVHKHYNQMKNR